MAFFVRKRNGLKKENVTYSVMDIKKGLRMIRLCNLQSEKTM